MEPTTVWIITKITTPCGAVPWGRLWYFSAASAKGALTQRLNAWRTMNRSDYHIAEVEMKEIK